MMCPMKQELPSVDLSSGKRRYLFWSNTKMALGRKIRSHRSENGKKIMGEDPQSLENKGFLQISQLVLHSNKKSHKIIVLDGFVILFLLFCVVCKSISALLTPTIDTNRLFDTK